MLVSLEYFCSSSVSALSDISMDLILDVTVSINVKVAFLIKKIG